MIDGKKYVSDRVFSTRPGSLGRHFFKYNGTPPGMSFNPIRGGPWGRQAGPEDASNKRLRLLATHFFSRQVHHATL